MRLHELMKVMEGSTKDEIFQVVGATHIKAIKPECVKTVTFWDENDRSIISPSLDWEFEYLEKKVSFMDAIRAFDNDEKDIKCIINGTTHIYKNNDIHCMLADENGLPISSKEMLEGTWYILN